MDVIAGTTPVIHLSFAKTRNALNRGKKDTELLSFRNQFGFIQDIAGEEKAFPDRWGGRLP